MTRCSAAAPGVCALHVLSHTSDPAGVHHVVGQSALFEQVLKLRAADGSVDSMRQLGPNFWALAVTDRLN